MPNWFLTKVQKLFKEEMIVFSANGIGTTEQPYAKKNEPPPKHDIWYKN